MKTFVTTAACEAAHLTPGEVVRSLETGAEYEVQTTGDFGGSPDGYVNRSTANGHVLVLQHNGVVDWRWCGAKVDGSDVSTEIQACLDYCRDNGLKWKSQGTFNAASTSLVNYTAGDGSAVVLTTTAGGQSTPVFNTVSVTADITLADATLLSDAQSTLPWVKGQATIAGLSAYAGKTLRIASTDDYITREGGTAYRHEIFFKVEDAEGNITPPLPFDVANTVTFTTADMRVVRDPIVVHAPLIKVISGSTDRTAGGLLQLERPNTTYIGGGVTNETTATMAILARMYQVVDATFKDMVITGAKEASTQYGYKTSGANLRLLNCSEGDCRRGMDGEYCTKATIIGGSYPDGVGGHLIFGLHVSGGAYLGVDDPNSAPVFVAGGDTSVDNCTLTNSYIGKAFVGVRGDVTEHIGRLSLTNCNLIADFSAETTTFDAPVINLQVPSGGRDPGRAIDMPSHVVMSGNTLRVAGTSHDCTMVLFKLDDDYSGVSQTINVNTRVDIHDNALDFENGAPKSRVGGVKQSTWAGSGFTFDITGLEDLLVYWGAASGTGDTTARSNFDIRKCGAVNMRTDGGATYRHLVECDTYTFSAAAGLTSKIGDEEWWHSRRGSLWTNNYASLADDAVISIPCTTYMTIMGIQRNAGAAGVAFQFTADTVGADGIVLHWSTGATVSLYTSTLTGTFGTDGNLNISAVDADNKIYIENRTGAAIPLALMKIHDG